MTNAPGERAQTQPAAQDFVLDLLAGLRAGGYCPAAWRAFLARSWRQSRATARGHPTLVVSWARVTLALALGEVGVLALEARLGRAGVAWRALPGAALGLVLQQADVYVHLGMHAPYRGGVVYPALGLPTTLTLVRQATAGLLWGHLLAGRPVARRYAACALLAAGATDIADGALARRSGRTSFLGQYLDGGADLGFALALALTLGARRAIPRWLLALLLLRWCAPALFASASYFGWGRRVSFASGLLGKAAGVAQALTLGAALAPPAVACRLGPARRALHCVTAVLLVAAPLGQLCHLRVAHESPTSRDA